MSASIHPAPLMLGPYELIERIATGGMAEVYLSRRAGPHGFQKVVAVKRILPQLCQDSDFVAMFVDEARVCARLAHPNIVQVFDFGEHDGELYMAMEYVDGTTAARLVRAAAARGEEVPLEAALYIALSILRGLDYAHSVRGEDGRALALVHRDVSPGNVLIDRSGAVKLTDFGIARAAEIERRTDAGQLKGKLGYMSPEQVVGKELDARSDLFTAAIVLAELVMLRPLFSGPNEIDVLMRIRDADLSVIDRAGARVPDDVKAILFRAMARDRTLRYATAGQFGEAIEEVLRRRRLQVGPGKLAAWIERLGLAPSGHEEGESETGTRQTSSLSVAPPSRIPSAPPARPSSVPGEMREVSPSIYRAKMPGGPTLGPFGYPRVVEMFVTGQIDHRVLLSRESSPFRDVAGYTELGRFVNSPAFRWDDSIWNANNGVQPVHRLQLPRRLLQLAIKRETGALYFRDATRKKKIYVVDGVPELVVSTEKRELFGEHLVMRGAVLRMEVEMALAMLPRFNGHLGDALVSLGVLRPIELVRAIQSQMLDRTTEVFTWEKGEVAFVRGARSHEETFPFAIEPYDLVVRGIRDGYTVEELEGLLAPLENDPITPIAPLPVRLGAFHFTEVEEQIIGAVKEPTTIADVSKVMRRVATREEVLRTIFCALSADILTSAKWTALRGV